MIHQQKSDGVTPELRATQTADPAAELRKAIQKHDLRFLGVSGLGVDVPGVLSGYSNPVVKIRGIHIISGTGDVIHLGEQFRLQDVAEKYARRYNRLLFVHLMKSNDPSVTKARLTIDHELLLLERSDPIRDAKKAVQGIPSLLFFQLSDDTVPGVAWKVVEATLRDYALIDSYGMVQGSEVLVVEIMTPLQRQRFNRQVSHYIAPYNRYIFEHYHRNKK